MKQVEIQTVWGILTRDYGNGWEIAESDSGGPEFHLTRAGARKHKRPGERVARVRVTHEFDQPQR